MRKSKLLLMILALVVVLAMVVACGNGDEPDPSGDNGTAANGTETNGTETNGTETNGPTPNIVETDPEPIARPASVVYSFATDEALQGAASGARGDIGVADGSPYLNQAGSPTFTIISGPVGINAIGVSGRNDHWDSLDIDTTAFEWDPSANRYMVGVLGSVADATTIRINGANPPYQVLDSVVMGEAGDFTLVAIIDADADLGSRGWLRIQTYPETVDFNVYNFAVTRLPSDENVVYQFSSDPFFQGLPVGVRGDGYDFVATPFLQSAGSPLFRTAAGPVGTSLMVTERNESWYALDLIYINSSGVNVHGLDLANNTYHLTVSGTTTQADGSFVIGGADDPWGWLANEEVGAGAFEVTFVMTNDSIMGIGDYPGTGSGDGGRRHMRLAPSTRDNYEIHEITITRQ